MEEAAEWLAALDAGSVDIDAFEAWRDSDSRHAVAFAQVVDAFEQVAGLRAVEERSPPGRDGVNRRKLLRAGALAGGAAAIAGSLAALQANARDQARTGVGERKTVLLPGGGRVELNTQTSISWRFNDKERSIWLEEGEIRLDVSKPEVKAIDIRTDAMRARVAQGSVNIRREPGSVGLLVLSGNVLLTGAKPVTIKHGEFANVIGRDVSVSEAEPVALERAAGWRNGQLVFEGESLDYVIGEFNRYLDRKIVIADPRLSRIRLGGRFTSTDPADLLTALQASFDVRVIRSGAGAITLTAR